MFSGSDYVLQWGHGDEAVEEAAVRQDDAGQDVLQWGHGDEAVEEADQPFGTGRAERKLQWGHGDEAVEEAGTSRGAQSTIDASMGPRR